MKSIKFLSLLCCLTFMPLALQPMEEGEESELGTGGMSKVKIGARVLQHNAKSMFYNHLVGREGVRSFDNRSKELHDTSTAALRADDKYWPTDDSQGYLTIGRNMAHNSWLDIKNWFRKKLYSFRYGQDYSTHVAALTKLRNEAKARAIGAAQHNGTDEETLEEMLDDIETKYQKALQEIHVTEKNQRTEAERYGQRKPRKRTRFDVKYDAANPQAYTDDFNDQEQSHLGQKTSTVKSFVSDMNRSPQLRGPAEMQAPKSLSEESFLQKAGRKGRTVVHSTTLN